MKILVTSRSVLNLREEWTFVVDGLRLPATENSPGTGSSPPLQEISASAAVQLFVSCAQRVRPHFELADEAAGVVAVCRLVEGLPLAIELASAWVKTLTAGEIAQEIRSNLDFLSTSMRNVPPRHRSFQAVFEYSWQLLNAEERAVFQRLSIFRGGFDREAAKDVAQASLATLTALVDHSLLQWHTDGHYKIHELLRQKAADQLQAQPVELAQLHEKHRTYYLGRFQEAATALRGAEQAQALASIQRDLPNLLVAWERALAESDLETAEIAMIVFWRYYWLRNQGQEGHRILSQGLTQLSQSEWPHDHPRYGSVLIRIHSMLGFFRYFLGDFDSAHHDLQLALAIAQDLHLAIEAGEARLGLGVIARWQGEHAAAIQDLEQALRLFREAEHPDGEADVLHEYAQLHSESGRYAEAKQMTTESLRISRALGRSDFIAWALESLGWVAFCEGDYATARAHYTESFNHFAEVEHQLGQSLALGGMGMVAWAEGRSGAAEAFSLVERSLQICREIEHRPHQATRLALLAQFCNDAEDYVGAEQYAREGLTIAETLNSPSILIGNLHCLAESAYYRGDFDGSRRYLDNTCRLALDAGLVPQLLIGLFHYATSLQIESELGTLAEDRSVGQQVEAVEFLQRVHDHPATWAIYRQRAGQRLAELRAKWPTQVHARAQARLAEQTFQAAVTALMQDDPHYLEA